MSITDNLEARLAAGKDDALLRLGLGTAYFNQNDLERAIPHLEQCIAMNPKLSAAYKFLGKALTRQNETERAKLTFEQGLTIANREGDKQTEREITVFLKKLSK